MKFDQWIQSHPLHAVSLYTGEQAKFLCDLADELLQTLDRWSRDNPKEGVEFLRTYNMFWLWVMGAYEISRTIETTHAIALKTMGLGDFVENAGQYKRSVAELRIPFAKHELRGNGKPVTSELSVTSAVSDLSFSIRGKDYSAKHCLQEFQLLMSRVNVKSSTND